MDLESIMQSEISQIEKNKYHMISLNMEFKKSKQMKTKQKQTQKEEQTYGCQRGGRWRDA